jgi:hypothetical protein
MPGKANIEIDSRTQVLIAVSSIQIKTGSTRLLEPGREAGLRDTLHRDAGARHLNSC